MGIMYNGTPLGTNIFKILYHVLKPHKNNCCKNNHSQGEIDNYMALNEIWQHANQVFQTKLNIANMNGKIAWLAYTSIIMLLHRN